MLKVAIVGRPNVGKSALFNRICRKKIAIVDEAEGITRDRLYGNADCFGRPFTVIDTGGIHAKSKALFNEEVKQQAEIAIEEADALILVVDGHVGLTQLDKEVADILVRTNKPIVLAVNKIDDITHEIHTHEFYSLGIKKIVGVSAAQGRNIAELLEEALKDLPQEEIVEEDSSIKIAIIGRPNVGKSTLVNYLLEDKRCIVSPIAGTTRDSIDAKLTWEGKEYTLIDTAGINKKHTETEVVDKFAFIRTERAIERADVCVLVLDANKGMTSQEKLIAGMIEEAGKGCILLFNKWDLVKGFRMEHCLKAIKDDASFLVHCPIVFGSAESGRNIEKIMSYVDTVAAACKERIPTAKLNKFIEATLQKVHPPMLKGKRLRIYYMAQVDIRPPKFILFVNNSNLMLETYKKFLLNQFREVFPFMGAPLSFHMKNKEKKELKRSGSPRALGETFIHHPDHDDALDGYLDEEDEDISDVDNFDESFEENSEE